MRRFTPLHMRKIGVAYGLFIIPMALVGYIATRGLFADPLSTAKVTLVLDKTQYHKGETVWFTLTNNGPDPVYVTNNCPYEPLRVYKQTGTEWQRRHTQSGQAVCEGKNRQVTVPPGEHATSSYKYWESLFTEPGRYKVVAELNDTNQGPSQEFEVLPD